MSLEQSDNLRSRLIKTAEQVAALYDVVDPCSGRPLVATVIEEAWSNPCQQCFRSALRNGGNGSQVFDPIYSANHDLATNLLVEELISLLTAHGYRPRIGLESPSSLGKTDVIINSARQPIEIRSNLTVVIVEVKTGRHLRWSQIFRYMLDHPEATLMIWRVRQQHVIVVRGAEVSDVLTAFCRACVSRMSRILDSTDIVECGHTRFERKWSLTSQECEQTVSDLFVGIRKTLPVLVDRIHDEIRNPWSSMGTGHISRA